MNKFKVKLSCNIRSMEWSRWPCGWGVLRQSERSGDLFSAGPWELYPRTKYSVCMGLSLSTGTNGYRQQIGKVNL